MPKRPISTDEAPPPGGGYSQAVVAGDFAFLAGATPTRPDGELLSGDFEAQFEQTFDNLEAVARAAGGSLAQAVRMGVFLRDIANFKEMDTLYRARMPEPLPARTTIQTALPGFEIEVDAVLYLGP